MSREVGAYIQLISEFQKPPSAPPARSEAGASGAVVGGCSPWMIVGHDELDRSHSLDLIAIRALFGPLSLSHSACLPTTPPTSYPEITAIELELALQPSKFVRQPFDSLKGCCKWVFVQYTRSVDYHADKVRQHYEAAGGAKRWGTCPGSQKGCTQRSDAAGPGGKPSWSWIFAFTPLLMSKDLSIEPELGLQRDGPGLDEDLHTTVQVTD
ncbi:hypothetical protein FB451DRAFT_1174075 [Mycena latifolia]|nr:hypothetical protein FB451DRAFT_1174075 [Mycena latifolia]